MVLGLAQLAAEAEQELEFGPGDIGDEDNSNGYRPSFGLQL
jgi:hypothetical protein